MKFWDSSVLVPLVSDEPTTQLLSKLAKRDPAMVVSFITPLEVTNAMYRKAAPNDDVRAHSERRYAALEHDWIIVTEYADALEAAMSIVRRHSLSSGDAIQLACAIIAAPDRKMPFVSLDGGLKRAAHAEGFPTLP